MTIAPLASDDFGARVLSSVIASAADSVEGVPEMNRSRFGIPVVVGAPTEFPSEDPEGTVNTRALHTLSGSTWTETKQPVPVRRLTNGRQIAVSVGNLGLCVQDTEFWAVNIGTLAPATHPLTGHAEGRAAVLAVKADGDLEIKDDRLDFVRRDTEGGDIEDGTLISLGYVSGTLTIKWADCAPHADLEGLEANPE